MEPTRHRHPCRLTPSANLKDSPLLRPAGTFKTIAYHSAMRSLFFVLMIALLLLRGWTGDAMATEMALSSLQHPQLATNTIANNTHGISAEAHFHAESKASESFSGMQAAHDCAGHAAHDAVPAAQGHCDACAACQSCNSVALTPAAVEANPVYSSHWLPRATAAPFTSAEAALGQKPPIS